MIRLSIEISLISDGKRNPYFTLQECFETIDNIDFKAIQSEMSELDKGILDDGTLINTISIEESLDRGFETIFGCAIYKNEDSTHSNFELLFQKVAQFIQKYKNQPKIENKLVT